ncbi:hypothetical protein PHYSODRAFT_257219 [Phytophthora sojae]|uniref:RRM domain-containing protein n=1 Tax=Phytophthora sojae (strain P6497) TaxID=1094619 RepID=G4ZTB1_PHYSP|nr:hypothetical protein PHYSODRAFT_257219 [Phytophthora sojae]EGZ12875.1 hypothetical protein PHYSODRAFT_257219 [Phytophthora sojae]|eukprot:XP_009530304.1 hypothetical protein PHYSODRAFT_257219 [Phytophthora sojae]
MSAKTVLITGSNRGIGLAFTKHFVANGWKVIAAARDPQSAIDLKLEKVVQIDTSDESSIKAAAELLKGEPIDLLINNAGIGGGGGIDQTTKTEMMKQFEVNTVGPFLVTRAFLPNLKLAVDQKGSATVGHVSSRMGSIADNGSGGMYCYALLLSSSILLGLTLLLSLLATPPLRQRLQPEPIPNMYGYRASKTALNMVNSSLATDLKDEKIIALALHPGYVVTRMTGQTTPEDSVAGLTKIVAEATPEDSGKFFHFNGSGLLCSMASPSRNSRSRSRSPAQSPSRRSSSRNARKGSASRSRSAPRSRSRSASNARSPADAKRSSSSKPEPKPVSLRVENLTRNVNADHLREIFGKFGLVVRVDMAVPRGKASAVVVFASQQDADSAKDHMHDGWLDGNKLRVLPDAPRPEPNNRRRVSLSPRSRSRRGGRGRSPSPTARSRQRSPPRGARGRRGVSPFRGRSRSRSRSFGNNRRGGRSRSRSPAFRRRGASPFRAPVEAGAEASAGAAAAASVAHVGEVAVEVQVAAGSEVGEEASAAEVAAEAPVVDAVDAAAPAAAEAAAAAEDKRCF